MSSGVAGAVTRGDAELRLPELLIEDDTDEGRWEGARCSTRSGTVPWPLQSALRFAVAQARLAHAEGEDAEARRYAQTALEEAGRDAPDLPRHPTVGLVTADKTVIDQMQKLAGR